MSLGVNDHHQLQVVNYMRFTRYQRAQRLRSIDGCFKQLRNSRLRDEDTTFTVAEVEEMLNELQGIVSNETESELLNAAHTGVLLMLQFFTQAEKWHLKLAADISELENRELLDRIRAFEEREFAGVSRTDKLRPMNDTGATDLLHAQIGRLEQENAQLRDRLRGAEGATGSWADEKAMLSAQVDSLRDQLERLSTGARGGRDERSDRLRDSRDLTGIERDLTNTKHELLKIRSMLDLAEKELEARVSETTPFKNIKRMLQQKNDVVRDLRRRLSRYERVDDEP